MASSLKSKLSFVCLSLLLQLSLAASVTQELKLSSQRALLLSRNLDGEEDPDHDHEEDPDHDHEEDPDHEHEHEHEEDHDDKPWGKVIGFTLIVNLATLSGVIFLIPVISYKARAWVKSCIWNEVVPSPPPKKGSAGRASFLDISIPSFASGALLATAVFLVIPEAIYLIQSFINEHAEEGEDPHAGHDHRFLNETDPHDGEEEHDEHAGEILPDTIWRFGSALLGGFMLPMLFSLLFPKFSEEHYAGDDCEVKPESFVEDSDEENANATPKKKVINYSLASSIVVGDALHNFCDGVFIGVALKGCDLAIVYTIVGVTLYHEIAQELADYFLLTKHAGLDPFRALALNFLAGLSVMIGGIAVVASNINDMALGVLLALSSGVYLYIAACECLPRVTEVVKTRQNRVLSMFMFILGVVPIGLALLNHSHCEGEGHAEEEHPDH